MSGSSLTASLQVAQGLIDLALLQPHHAEAIVGSRIRRCNGQGSEEVLARRFHPSLHQQHHAQVIVRGR